MESGPGTATATRPLVLVCDDIPSIREVIRINLELEGFDVVEAADGHEAMSQLINPAAPVPAVIVLDAQTPRRDGWWAIAAIRSHPRLADVPTILVTASTTAHDRSEADLAGFDAFVAKPFDPFELVEVVSRLAAQGRPRRRGQ
ncbi:response regulator receiver domain-containing protein [Knoellia remsis]|uniref:Response regulator receiver domain-containing protein n=1 Tax=Knoellia remsis TaxID=407159 RepID=A0A2T0UYL3_9MICO|nr:response regulator [Knoellia remsis]PRY62928.1 response regulator receiver domain-containing protein [Knoellia remsis]